MSTPYDTDEELLVENDTSLQIRALNDAFRHERSHCTASGRAASLPHRPGQCQPPIIPCPELAPPTAIPHRQLANMRANGVRSLRGVILAVPPPDVAGGEGPYRRRRHRRHIFGIGRAPFGALLFFRLRGSERLIVDFGVGFVGVICAGV